MKINLLKVKMCKTKKGSSLLIILLSGPDGLEPASTSVETVIGQHSKHYCRNCFTIFFCDAIRSSICECEYFLSAFSRFNARVLLAQSSM